MEYGAPRGKPEKHRDSGESHTSVPRRNQRQIIEHDCSAVNIREGQPPAGHRLLIFYASR